jgi:outer membrane protein OmpA-like peptidoglycan-associated protein
MSNTNYGRENYSAWTWGVAALLLLALIWLWIIGRGPGSSAACCGAGAATATAASAPVAATPVAPLAAGTPTTPTEAAPAASANTAAGTAAASAAAAAVATKPKATLYFDVNKTSAPADTSQLIADVVAYLLKNKDSKAVVSGYNDPSGNAAANAELSKNRAKSTREALKAAGIEETRIELRKPSDTNLGGDPKEARRVEVTVEP